MLSDDFKFEISLGNITQDNEHLFKGKLTKISFTKGSINLFSKLMELSKLQMKEALMIQREILGLGDCSESAHINYYFTSPF
jgi:hypothetical protein